MLIDTGVMLLAEIDGTVVGMVGLVIAPFFFNRSRITAHEVVWWVHPDAQGRVPGRHAGRD